MRSSLGLCCAATKLLDRVSNTGNGTPVETCVVCVYECECMNMNVYNNILHVNEYA